MTTPKSAADELAEAVRDYVMCGMRLGTFSDLRDALARYDREKPADRVRELEAEVARLWKYAVMLENACGPRLVDDARRATGVDWVEPKAAHIGMFSAAQCRELQGHIRELLTTTPPGPTPT